MTLPGETNSARSVHAYAGLMASHPGDGRFIRVVAGGGSADLTLDQARELLDELQALLDRSDSP